MEISKSTAKYLQQMQRYSELNEEEEDEIEIEYEETKPCSPEPMGNLLNRIKQFVSPAAKQFPASPKERNCDTLPDLDTGEIDFPELLSNAHVSSAGAKRFPACPKERNCDTLPDLETDEIDFPELISNTRVSSASPLNLVEEFDNKMFKVEPPESKKLKFEVMQTDCLQYFTLGMRTKQMPSLLSDDPKLKNIAVKFDSDELPDLDPYYMCDMKTEIDCKQMECLNKLEPFSEDNKKILPAIAEYANVPSLVCCTEELHDFEPKYVYNVKENYETIYGETQCDENSIEYCTIDESSTESILVPLEEKRQHDVGPHSNNEKFCFAELDIPWKVSPFPCDASEINAGLEEKILKFFKNTTFDLEDGEEFEPILIQFLTVIPPSCIPADYIEELLKHMETFTITASHKIFDVLMDMTHFNKIISSKQAWSLLERNVCKMLKDFQAAELCDQRSFLVLQYIVSAAAVSVQQKVIIPGKFNFRNTLAWDLFCQTSHVNKIASWYGEILRQFSSQQCQTNEQSKMFELLEGLQSVLTIALTVSICPCDTAYDISIELEKHYETLLNVAERKEFLQCLMCSDLVRYILVQHLLQNKFGFKEEVKTNVYPLDCQAIVENYCINIDVESVDNGLELILLTIFILCNFCSSFKEQLHLPLHERKLSGQQELSKENIAALAVLDNYKTYLEMNIKCLKPDIAAHPMCSELLDTLSFLSFIL